MSKYLITGGLGMIGSEIANNLFNQGHTVHLLDAMTYAADPDRLERPVLNFSHDITMPIRTKFVGTDYDYILHLAAETHVDNSIDDPMSFVMTNVVGTANMLEFARKCPNLKTFLYFSTDEVFGPAPNDVNYKEWDRFNSGNPYAATKAGAEELTLSYGNTYKLPIMITHTMNCFGPRQHIEKFIPSTIRKIKDGETVIIHSDKTKQVSGSRYYIHTKNVASATDFVLENGSHQDKYNIVGEKEVSNLELALKIASILNKPLKYEMVDFHTQRPGHDLRYALDGTKLRTMGWKPANSFEQDLAETVAFYD